MSGSAGTIEIFASDQGSITISGSGVSLETETFFLGNENASMSGSNGNILISGSNIDLITPTFLLGLKGIPIGQTFASSNGASFLQYHGYPASNAHWFNSSGASNGIYNTNYAWWSNGNSPDGTNVDATGTTANTPDYILINGFDFSGISDNLDVVGIEVNLQAMGLIDGVNSVVADNEIYLVKDFTDLAGALTSSLNEAKPGVSGQWNYLTPTTADIQKDATSTSHVSQTPVWNDPADAVDVDFTKYRNSRRLE
jgi:hypothetical protein